MGLTKIEWTSFPRPDGTYMPGYSVNLWWGCMAVSPGCTNCYAEVLDKRWGGGHWGAKAPRRIIKGAFDMLRNYQKDAEKAGEVRGVFVGSMMDIFEKPIPVVDKNGAPVTRKNGFQVTTGHLRAELFRAIDMGWFPNLMFLLLTKRPGNILKYIPESWKENPPANVMYGTSPVNQETADDMIPKLLAVPGKHFLSCEPLLGPMRINWIDAPDNDNAGASRIFPFTGRRTDMGRPCYPTGKIDWVIVGGESGPHARPMHPDWAKSLRDQCEEAGVPFFFKQWGEYTPYGERFQEESRQWNTYINDDGSSGQVCFLSDGVTAANYTGEIDDNAAIVTKVGKKAAGHLLDGKEYHQFPL